MPVLWYDPPTKMKVKFFKKEIQLDSDFFEAVFTIICTFAAMVLGILHIPTNVPLNLFNYLAMVGVLGFVFGFMTSSGIVSLFKRKK